jgi:serine/threonine-protein kinase
MLDVLFETHSALMTAAPTTATTSAQRTMVLPSATPAVHTTAETQVIGSRGRVVTTPTPAATDSTATLAHSTARRRRRAWWLAGLVAVLVVLAAGTGWYFGAGPGSRITLPTNLSGTSIEDATAALEALGLTVDPATGSTDDPRVPVGQVAGTDPPLGTQVAPGSTVQLLLSTGPAQLALPVLAGMSEADATAAIAAAPFTLKGSLQQFDGTVPLGTVIDALAADGSSLAGVATYGELQPITLLVSAGPLPEVGGLSVADATSLLTQAGLTLGAINEAEFSDSVPQSNVIRAQSSSDSPIRVGDTVDLITSRGIEQIEIPDVIGLTVNEATDALEAAGFAVSDPGISEGLRNSYRVTGTNPGSGEFADKGSTISFTGFTTGG